MVDHPELDAVTLGGHADFLTAARAWLMEVGLDKEVLVPEPPSPPNKSFPLLLL
jgi:hypothetical protein